MVVIRGPVVAPMFTIRFMLLEGFGRNPPRRIAERRDLALDGLVRRAAVLDLHADRLGREGGP